MVAHMGFSLKERKRPTHVLTTVWKNKGLGILRGENNQLERNKMQVNKKEDLWEVKTLLEKKKKKKENTKF